MFPIVRGVGPAAITALRPAEVTSSPTSSDLRLLPQGQQKTGAVLYHRKARFEELGYACKLNLDYHLKLGRYKSVNYEIT